MTEFSAVWAYNPNYRYFTVFGLPETEFRFATFSDRDRFWADLTPAIQAWASKYPQFVFVQLDIEKRCIDGQHAGFVPCSESGRSGEAANAGATESVSAISSGSAKVLSAQGAPLALAVKETADFMIQNENEMFPARIYLNDAKTPIVIKIKSSHTVQLEVGSTHAVRVIETTKKRGGAE